MGFLEWLRHLLTFAVLLAAVWGLFVWWTEPKNPGDGS